MQSEASRILEVLQDYASFLSSVFSEPLALKIVYVALTILFGVLAIRIIGFFMKRMVLKNIISQAAYDKLYSILSLTGYFFILVILLTIVTESPITIYVLAAVIVVAFASGYDVLSNVISYYAIILNRPLMIGSTVTIDGITGKVREITPLYVEIKCNSGDVVKIPNRRLFRSSLLIHGITHPVSVRIIMRGTNDLREAEREIRSSLQDFKDTVLTSKPEVGLSKIGSGSVEFKVTVYVTSVDRASHVKTELSRTLYERLGDKVLEINVD